MAHVRPSFSPGRAVCARPAAARPGRRRAARATRPAPARRAHPTAAAL